MKKLRIQDCTSILQSMYFKIARSESRQNFQLFFNNSSLVTHVQAATEQSALLHTNTYIHLKNINWNDLALLTTKKL